MSSYQAAGASPGSLGTSEHNHPLHAAIYRSLEPLSGTPGDHRLHLWYFQLPSVNGLDLVKEFIPGLVGLHFIAGFATRNYIALNVSLGAVYPVDAVVTEVFVTRVPHLAR